MAGPNPGISRELMDRLETYLHDKILKDIFFGEMVKCNCALETNWQDMMTATEIETTVLLEDLVREGVDVKKSPEFAKMLKMHELMKDLRDPNWRADGDKKFKKLDYVETDRFRKDIIDDYLKVSSDFKNAVVVYGRLDRTKYQVTPDTREIALRLYMPGLLNMGEYTDTGNTTNEDGGVVRIESNNLSESPSYREINECLGSLFEVTSYSVAPLDGVKSKLKSLGDVVKKYGIDDPSVVDDIDRIVTRMDRMGSDGITTLEKGKSEVLMYDIPDVSKRVKSYLTQLARSS